MTRRPAPPDGPRRRATCVLSPARHPPGPPLAIRRTFGRGRERRRTVVGSHGDPLRRTEGLWVGPAGGDPFGRDPHGDPLRVRCGSPGTRQREHGAWRPAPIAGSARCVTTVRRGAFARVPTAAPVGNQAGSGPDRGRRQLGRVRGRAAGQGRKRTARSSSSHRPSLKRRGDRPVRVTRVSPNARRVHACRPLRGISP